MPDDGAHQPADARRLLAHLPQPEAQEAPVVLVGPFVRHLERQVAAIEQRLDVLLAQRHEPESLGLDHASGPRRKMRPIEGR
jgi:hypothetical protein